MNEIYNKYGQKIITHVLYEYIVVGNIQSVIANKYCLDQRGDVSPIITSCNFNDKRSSPFETGKSLGIYKNRPHPLKNGNSVVITLDIIANFVEAWKNNEYLTFSEYLERTYGGSGARTSNNGSYGSTFTNTNASYGGSSYGGSSCNSPSYGGSSTTRSNDNYSSSSGEEILAMGCGTLVFIALAIFLLPKIPFVGGLFSALFGGIKNLAVGGFWSIAYTLAGFGPIVIAIGLIIAVGAKVFSPKSSAGRIGGSMICLGFALSYLTAGTIYLSLIFGAVAIWLYTTRKKNDF